MVGSVKEDVELYVEEALASGGPVVELAVGTGRIAVPTAKAGIGVIGIDQSPGMLSVARAYAEREGVAERLDLRVGDLRQPPVTERVPLVTIPFRSMLHMATTTTGPGARRRGRDARARRPTRFDVFAPSDQDITETDGLWLEREPGIFERADWNPRCACSSSPFAARAGGDLRAPLALAPGVERPDRGCGLRGRGAYGWFDRRPFEGGEDQIWICRAACRREFEHHADAHGPRLEHLRVYPEACLAVVMPRFSMSSRMTS